MAVPSVMFALALAALSPPLDSVVYAIHKPRNVLSAAADRGGVSAATDRGGVSAGGSSGHVTLTDIMIEAGVEPLTGHVGRLDAETSGLILVTSDSLLLRACLGWPDVLSSYGGRTLTKRYEVLLAGRHEEASSDALRSLAAPLTHQRGGKAYESAAADAVIHRGCFVDDALASGEAALLDRHDDAVVARLRAKISAKRTRPTYSRATGAAVAPYVPHGGWLTRVELVLRQGRHHQVRRLVRRAGLRLLHLRRVAVGPITLADEAKPGEVRVLGTEEKLMLYERCLPRLLEGPEAAEEARRALARAVEAERSASGRG